MTIYNHAFTIAFSVVTRNPGESVTAAELRAGLERRLREMIRSADYDEIVEACGMPCDTFLYSPDLHPPVLDTPV